jgi:hypothetical protein
VLLNNGKIYSKLNKSKEDKFINFVACLIIECFLEDYLKLKFDKKFIYPGGLYKDGIVLFYIAY